MGPESDGLKLTLVSAVRVSKIIESNRIIPKHGTTLKENSPHKFTCLISGSKKILTYGNFPSEYWPNIVESISNNWAIKISDEIEIANAVFTGVIKSHCNNSIRINLENLGDYLLDCSFEPEQFPGAIIRFSSNPKSTLLLYSSGSIVVTGIGRLDFAQGVENDELTDLCNEILGEKSLYKIVQ